MEKTLFSLLRSQPATQVAGPSSSGRRQVEPAVAPPAGALVPARGCLAGGGRWLLSTTAEPVGCVEPSPWRRDALPGPPSDLAESVQATLARRSGAGRPREVVIGADVDPLLLDERSSLPILRAARAMVEAGVRLRLCTRGAPHPESPFGRLLARAAVRAGATLEVALLSVDEGIASLYEPKAPPPAERLAAARRLHGRGVVIEGRVGPMLPWIADTAAHLERLVAAFREAGARRLHASYIQLDGEGAKRMRRLPPAQRALLKGCFNRRPRHATEAVLLPKDLRAKGYARLRRVALRAEVEVIVCRESNPDLSIASGCVSERSLGSGTGAKSRSRLPRFALMPKGGGESVAGGPVQPDRIGPRRPAGSRLRRAPSVCGGRQLDLFGGGRESHRRR